MGEQSREGETEEASFFNPFVRSHVEYDPDTRLQMAENMAATRRLTVSPALKDIITNPENFYQQCQLTTKMIENAQQRRFTSFNTKREAQIHLKRVEGLPLPSKISMIEINPTRVTLSLEFESQYYSLMTNECGDNENVGAIMNQTNTLIQIPDRVSDVSSPDPFVQQVIITGLYSDVDRARKLMRENCHVSVIMSLSEMKISMSDLEALIRESANPFVEIQTIHTSTDEEGKRKFHLRFTSRSKNEEHLIKVAEEISKKTFRDESPQDDLFSIHFTLSTFHVEHVLGTSTSQLLMPEVEAHTGTKIKHPSFKTRDEIKSNTVVIEVIGKVKNVLKARKCIIDLLPISICVNMKNTDMAASVSDHDRHVRMFLPEFKTQLKLTASAFEPAELLAEEVPLNCASLCSKEFNLKNVYLAYQQMLSKKLGVVAPQPDSYDDSFWHENLDASFFSFQMPCRGEAPDSVNHMRRHRTSSMTSFQSKRSRSYKGKINNESNVDLRGHSRNPSTSETLPLVNMSHDGYYVHPSLMYQQNLAMMKGGAPGFHQPVYVHSPLSVPMIVLRPEYASNLPPEAFFAYVSPYQTIYDAEPLLGRADSPSMTHSQKKHTARGGMRIPTSRGETPPGLRQPRIYESAKEDDARSSTRSHSRRTSVSGEEPPVGSFEDKNYDRTGQRQFHKTRYDGSRSKSGRGDMHGKRNTPNQKEFRSHSQQEFRGGSTEQLQFQMTHHLQLKASNDVDLDQERLFTDDNSQLEENQFSPGNNVGAELTMDRSDRDFVHRLFSTASLNSELDSNMRSRAASCSFEKEMQSARFTDSECTFSAADHPSSHQSRSIENFKKVPPAGVTKTMLEPRSRGDRGLNKVSLEIRRQHFEPQNDENSLGTRMDPMTLIAQVKQSNDQLPRIHERQFSDILNEKEKEMSSSTFKDGDATVVQDPSFEESSTMDYAFRIEQSSENVLT